jgi:hypothetical protein
MTYHRLEDHKSPAALVGNSLLPVFDETLHFFAVLVPLHQHFFHPWFQR